MRDLSIAILFSIAQDCYNKQEFSSQKQEDYNVLSLHLSTLRGVAGQRKWKLMP